MVILGPLVVIVAALYTYYLAANTPNEIVTDPQLVKKIMAERAQGKKSMDAKDAPADMARNHATTGPVPLGQTGEAK